MPAISRGERQRTARVDVAHQPVDGLGLKVTDLDHTGLCFLKAASEGLLEPHTARAQDVLVEAPGSVAALDSHVGEEPRAEQPECRSGSVGQRVPMTRYEVRRTDERTEMEILTFRPPIRTGSPSRRRRVWPSLPSNDLMIEGGC